MSMVPTWRLFTSHPRPVSLPPQEGKYYSEEAEVDLRDPGRDYELYKYTCQELQRLMAEIQDLKSRGGKDVVSSRVDEHEPGGSAWIDLFRTCQCPF